VLLRIDQKRTHHAHVRSAISLAEANLRDRTVRRAWTIALGSCVNEV